MKTRRNKAKKSSVIIMIVSVIVIGFLAFTAFKGLNIFGVFEIKPFSQVIKQGLDLQGGFSVVMEIQDEDVTSEQLNNTKEQLELRVNKVGVSETVVTTEGDKRIRVDIPGQYDSSEIVNSLSQSGELTFTSPDGDVLLTGSDVSKATVVTNSETSKIEIQLEMTEDGKSKFADATSKYVGQAISIKMDDEVLSSPTVQTAITDGVAQITGDYTAESAKRLAGLINSGALPVTVKAASVQTVGSQLGADALPNALKASIIGIALVFIFMIVVYRIPGLLADLALALFIYIVLFIFGEVGVTLTLPGIAALMLTIGMAVDANVLIFERTKEELKKGISIKTAVQKGFENARSSIVDSNVTTILAALVLYFLGSGSVKGFAVTLLIGVLASMFTALTVTRFFIKKSVEARFLSKLSHFGVKKEVVEE